MKLYLKDARLSFTQALFDPKAGPQGGKLKFSVDSIIESGTTKGAYCEVHPESTRGRQQNIQWVDPKVAVNAALMAAANSKWGAKALEIATQLKAADKLCVHDGDSKAQYPGYKGNLFVKASNEIKPSIRDKQGRDIEASHGVIYSGCYADVVVEVWAQDNQFGKRLNGSLLAVVFSKDGERLAGGGVASADDYAEIPENVQQQATASGEGAGSVFGVTAPAQVAASVAGLL